MQIVYSVATMALGRAKVFFLYVYSFFKSIGTKYVNRPNFINGPCGISKSEVWPASLKNLIDGPDSFKTFNK